MNAEPPTGGSRRAKKTAAKKTAAKKTAAKKTAAKKTGAKKTGAKKTGAKKSTGPTRTTRASGSEPTVGPGRPPGSKAPTSVAPGEPPPGTLGDPDEVIDAASAIIDVFEHRPDLYLAACANPIRALRDAGVHLSPGAERWVAHRCRFSPDETEQLDLLAEQITHHLGDIDPDDDAAVRRALRDIGVDIPLRSKQPKGAASAATEAISTAAVAQSTPKRPRPTGPTKELHPVRRSVLRAAEQLPQVHRWREARRAAPDPLEEYRGAHAVMKPLLQYRHRSATQPRFASDEVYERLAATKGGQLASGINIELHVRFTGNGDG